MKYKYSKSIKEYKMSRFLKYQNHYLGERIKMYVQVYLLNASKSQYFLSRVCFNLRLDGVASTIYEQTVVYIF